jgi:hypothetical protein
MATNWSGGRTRVLYNPASQRLMEQPQEAVIVRLKLSDDEFGLPEERAAVYAIEDQLVESVAAPGVGEVDGHEFGNGFATIYLYGPSADRLHDCAKEVIAAVRVRPGSTITKRFGQPGACEETTIL